VPLSDADKAKIALLRAELQRRGADTFMDLGFKHQCDFINDPARLKVGLCTRRAGKSYGAGVYLFKVARKTPNCSVLYLALTRESARGIMWKDVVKRIDREHSLGCVFHENALTCTLPNGSVIYLLGADSSEEEKAKLLGRKFALVVVDEAASFTTDLTDLVYKTLKPAVADYRGTIVLISTPSNYKTGLFYELTQGQDPMTPGTWETRGWKGFRWTAFDNPYMAEKWQEEIDALVKANPRVVETGWYRQMFEGRWTTDDSLLVYKYTPGVNDYGDLPDYMSLKGEWHHVLGVDLGFNDETSFVTVAYHDADPVLYIEDVEKEAKLDLTDVATRIKRLTSIYGYETLVVDGANKQGVEEIRRRHGIPLRAAEKRAKSEYIDLMNADLARGLVKLSPRATPLRDEYAQLVWDERALKREKDKRRVEHPGCKNHAADATLYAWRYCLPFLFSRQAPALKAGTREWYDAEARKMEEEAIERLADRERQDREEEWLL